MFDILTNQTIVMAEEKRIPVIADEKKYAILTKESVKVMAESAGHSDIPDTVTGLLGEDVSYRLREITQVRATINTYITSKSHLLITIKFVK